MSRSTAGYILQKKASTGELNNIKRPGRPQKTTKVDDLRTLSLVKKPPSYHLHKSTILRRRSAHHRPNLQSRDAFMHVNTKKMHTTGNSQERQGKIRLSQKTLFFGLMKPRLRDGKRRVWRKIAARVKHAGAVSWDGHV